MKKPSERESTALLIVDMQNGVVAGSHRLDEVIANINVLVERARAAKIAVIWIQHSDNGMKEDSASWQLVSQLIPEASDTLIRKRYLDSFEDTDLEAQLSRLDVKRVVVAGAQTDACIRAVLHGAFVRGYETTLIGDAHTTEDQSSHGLPAPEQLIQFTNTYWTWQAAPGRRGVVSKTAEVDFGH